MNNSSQFYTLSDTKAYYDSEESLPLLIIDTEQCHAVISLYGGQVLTFQAANKAPLLWLSPSVVFKEGSAIRGGIPICAPWFGNHPTFSLNHGFARISHWSLDTIKQLENDDVVLSLKLTDNDLSKEYDYQQFTMTLNITLGQSLTVDFSFENHRDESQVCDWAMHSYFQVKDCKTTTVNGLENYTYHDKTQNNETAALNEPQTFTQEVDRLFVNASSIQTVNNAAPIAIEGTNCDSVIVWNPGEALAQKMQDVTQSHHFVCLERGAVKDNAWRILPHQKEVASVTMKN